MKIEDMTPWDVADVERLHNRSGFDYVLPDLSSPLFVVKQVVRDDEGRIVAACGLRLQAETYLWVDNDIPNDVRSKAVVDLSRSIVAAAWRVGLDCLVAWLPPGLPKSFHNFLVKRLGWKPDRKGWHTWSLPVE